MKYIRLTTDNDKTEFRNRFNGNINIKPNSKIALESASFNVYTPSFTVNGTNNTITYNITSNLQRKVYLDDKTYDKSNLDSIYTDITTKLNLDFSNYYTLGYITGSLYGYQFLCDNTDNKTNIKLSKSSVVNFHTNNTDNYFITDAMDNVNNGEKWFKSSGGQDLNNFISAKMPICNGIGAIRCRAQIQNQTGTTTDKGFIIGLFDENPMTNGIASKADINYYIHISNEGNAVKVRANGTDYLTTFTPTAANLNGSNTADVYEILITGDVITFLRYSNTSTTVLHTESFDRTKEYYGFFNPRDLGTESNNRVRIIQPRFTPNPYVNTQELHIDEDLSLGHAAPQIQYQKTSKAIQLSENLAEYLGYYEGTQIITRTPETGYNYTVDINFVSNYPLKTLVNESFIVELLNLDIDSFDGLTNQRQNIISVIPEHNIDNVINYNPNNLIFIDIKNTQELTLRNLNARVLNKHYGTVITRGLSSLTFIIKDENE